MNGIPAIPADTETRVVIDELTVFALDWPDQYGHSYAWRANADVPRVEAHRDSGRILVTLDVDGNLDTVHADLDSSGQIAALDRAIAALATIRDALTTAYQGRGHPGQCFENGDWGRCRADAGHPDGQHRFPTEQDWQISRPQVSSVAL